MAQAQRKATQIAKSIAAKSVESTIAAMPGKTDTPTVRAARAPGLKVGANYTGQYLYERFVNDKAENKADVTRMDIIKDMCQVLDLSAYDATLAGMVGFANRARKDAIEAAKAAGNYNSENPTYPIRVADAQLKTARNHQSVMRLAWGTIHHCAPELEAKLGGAELSYKMIRDIGSKLLKDKGIDWKGNKVESPDGRAARAEQRMETDAMLEVQKANPRQEGESRADYFARIDHATEAKMKELKEQERVNAVAKMVAKIREMAGENLPDIIDSLLSVEPEQVAPSPDKNLH